MSRIRVLPDHVANQIAAGEVVERPSSVLKELLENALDAGATRLEVRWEDGGKALLEVADDGCGMERDDLYLALERHATSKIRTAEDLVQLESFGFRGEALPSIASVSRLDLHSAAEEGAGHLLRCEFGVIKGVTGQPRARGTTVTVRDLFAQVPARRRFLKSRETEHAHLWGVVTRMALATPGVHWIIRTERATHLNLPPVADPGARLAPLLGEPFGAMLHFRHGELPFLLEGFLSPPELSFRSREHLYLYVNGRSVRDRLLLGALAQGWEGVFPKGAYPAVVAFLELPAEAVDVNVHPTKAEVRFREPQRIFPWVAQATREAWAQLKAEVASVLDLPPRPRELEFELPPPRAASTQVRGLWDAAILEAPGDPPPRTDLDRPYATAVPAPAVGEALDGEAAPRYLGAFQGTYLLAEVPGEREPELWLVDQHVAHERVLYERLFLRQHAPAVHRLLAPVVVHLGPAQAARLHPFLGEFAGAGFDLEPFGEDALAVRGLPDFLSDRDPRSLLEALLQRLEATGRPDLDTFRRELNAELACRGAVKKHQPLAPELARQLLRDLMRCQVPHTCPHGRPVVKKLSLSELERSFGRRA